MDVFNWTRPEPAPIPRPPRTYYAKRLLEHGPLTFTQFREITGWKGRIPGSVLSALKESGVAECNKGEWSLTNA